MSRIEGVRNILIVERTPCLVEPRRFKIKAKTDKPLGDVLPVVYLALPSSNYSETHGSLSFLMNGRLVGVFSDGTINASCFEDLKEAEALLEELRNLLNAAFEYLRQKGKPDTEMLNIRRRASPLEVYKHLPKINCKDCGEDNCLAFAVKLLNGERKLDECPRIGSKERAFLKKMVQPIELSWRMQTVGG